MDYQTTKMMQGLIRTKTLSMDERKAMYQQLRIEMLEKKPMLQKKYANLPLTGYKTLEEYTNAMETIFLEADEDGQLLSMMLETQKDNQELFEHSVEVWYVSLFLIEQIDHIKDGTVNQKKLYEKEIVATGIAALLHDLGKCKNYITAEQAEHMNRIERANYREHVIQGNAILKDKQMDTTIMQGVLQHHECYDGSGFPMGIKGGNLGTIAKVIGLADFYVHVMAHEISDPFELDSSWLSNVGRSLFINRISLRTRPIPWAPLFMASVISLGSLQFAHISSLSPQGITISFSFSAIIETLARSSCFIRWVNSAIVPSLGLMYTSPE